MAKSRRDVEVVWKIDTGQDFLFLRERKKTQPKQMSEKVRLSADWRLENTILANK